MSDICDNHSIGYCMIGYLCAYLRYYHPHEFITAFLNNANGEEDIKNGSELASLYKIKITPPRFGLSYDKYLFHKEQNVISKGLSSVKFMNKNVARQLYELANAGKPETFTDLLISMRDNVSIDTRQRDILIKIDFFSEYGNAKELLRIVDAFSFFKEGTMVKISKEKLSPEMTEIVKRYATDVQKSGKPAKSYTFTDLYGLLRHLERHVRSFNVEDFDFKTKLQMQQEYLGYTDITTNREEDRKKLLVTNVYPLKSKMSTSVWAYSIQAKSIGSGKANYWTIYAETFERNPIREMDIIYVDRWDKRKGQYLYIYQYHHVI